MDFKFYDEYIKRTPSATPEQVQKAWNESGYAPQGNLIKPQGLYY